MSESAVGSRVRRVLILADESADWEIAGVLQLERLCLTLNEDAASQPGGEEIHASVLGHSSLTGTAGSAWPDPAQTPFVRLRREAPEAFQILPPFDAVLSTRLVVPRNRREKWIDLTSSVTLPSPSAPDVLWQTLSDEIRQRFTRNGSAEANSPIFYLSTRHDIRAAEKFLLGATAKREDGVISRCINRPISQRISLLLVRTSISPATWTRLIMLIAIGGCFFLLRGDYVGFVVGTALYQAYSILDGCDGEIARAKFLDSERGRRLDTTCDMIAHLLMLLSLGFGLARANAREIFGWNYVIEAIVAAICVLGNEWLLAKSMRSAGTRPEEAPIGVAFYQRHALMLQRSGSLILGERALWWLFQLTKRDVAVLFFVVLAVAGLPQWILHLSGTIAAASLLLAGKALFHDRRPREGRP